MDSDGQMDVDTIPSSSKGKGKANVESNEPHENETLPWLRCHLHLRPQRLCSFT